MASDLASWDEKVSSYWADILPASGFRIDVLCTQSFRGSQLRLEHLAQSPDGRTAMVIA